MSPRISAQRQANPPRFASRIHLFPLQSTGVSQGETSRCPRVFWAFGARRCNVSSRNIPQRADAAVSEPGSAPVRGRRFLRAASSTSAALPAMSLMSRAATHALACASCMKRLFGSAIGSGRNYTCRQECRRCGQSLPADRETCTARLKQGRRQRVGLVLELRDFRLLLPNRPSQGWHELVRNQRELAMGRFPASYVLLSSQYVLRQPLFSKDRARPPGSLASVD
jgi:hypothetical protein